MSRRSSKIEKNAFIDNALSGGDTKRTTSKKIYQEENNNKVDELSKELSEMGCIVDSIKKPPNICDDHCATKSVVEDEKKESKDNEEDLYSDEFEEEKSESEELANVEKNEAMTQRMPSRLSNMTAVKKSKSQNSMMSRKTPSLSRSSDFGSVSVPSTRRVNMSFSNERLREIERHNHILLNKIMSARNNRKSSIPPRECEARRLPPPAAVHRKRQQRQIDHDNMILLKKIQRAKSTACSLRR